MTPVTFQGCFGWLHPAAGKRGAVLCGTFGIEDLAAHREWRALAQMLAEAGVPTLRFDYRGVGDSEGDESRPALVADWKASIADAVAYLRAETGVEEIVLIGLRAGATLAAAAAAEIGGVDRIALLAPAVSGRGFLRETKALAAFQNGGYGVFVAADGALEAAGFTFSAETQRDMAKLDLLKLDRRPAPKALLLSPPHMPTDPRVKGKLEALGAEVEEKIFFGCDNLLLEACYGKDMPLAAFHSVVKFAAEGMATGERAAPWPTAPTLAFDGLIEEPATFGPRGGLSGVLCSPAGETDASRPAVLIINTGHHRRVGAGRLGVTMARRLAAEGWTSLRFDLAGLGDSDPQAGKPDNMVYDIESVADVRAALDYLEARGHRSAVAVGLCSGAYVALHAARADERIVAQALVNLRRFTWRKGETFATATRAGTRTATALVGEARAAWRRPDIWLRLAKGGRKEWSMVAAAGRRMGELARAKASAKLSEAFGIEGKIPGWISALGRRGTATLIAYGPQDEGLEEFHTHLGRDAALVRHRDALRIATIVDSDHTLTTRAARANFIGLFVDFLAERPWTAGERAAGKDARPRRRATSQPAEALVAL